jgi:Anti-sigma-D factor RsdA to sigma factor binding region
MPDSGRGRSADGESLDAIARSDALINALAGQYREPVADRGEAELMALLEGWRDGVRRPTADHVISEHQAATALRQGMTQRPTENKGTRRHLAVVGSVAAAVACVGGFGAIVAGAGPGDSLYGMRTALFGEPASVRDDRVALAAQTEMAEVQRLIDQGDWGQAQQKLETITTAVADVTDTSVQQELQQQWDLLNVRVESQDPAATLPPTVTPGPETVPGNGESVTVTLPSSDTLSSSTTSPGESTSVETTSPSVDATSPSTTPSTTPAPSSTTTTSTTTSSTTTSSTTTSSTTASSTTATTTTSRSTTSTTTTTSPTSTTTTTTTLPQAEGPESSQAPASAPAQVPPSSPVVEAETETVPTVEEEVPTSALPTTTTTVPVIQLPIPGLN